MNHVLLELIKASDRIHELEEAGIELTDEEDQMWVELTELIEKYR